MNKFFKKYFVAIILFGAIISVNGIAQAKEGDVWIVLPDKKELSANEKFDAEVHVDTGKRHLNNFNMYLDFDPKELTIDTNNGENPQADDGKGFHKTEITKDYMMGSNAGDIANGHFRFAGTKPNGEIVGNDQNIIIIHLKTTEKFTPSELNLSLRVDELAEFKDGDLSVGKITGIGTVKIKEITSINNVKSKKGIFSKQTFLWVVLLLALIFLLRYTNKKNRK